MKKIYIRLLFLITAVSLTGCQSSDDNYDPVYVDESSAPSESSSAADSSPIEIIVEDDTQPPAAGMLRSRLTNEWVSADTASVRPLAVIIPNESSALPQYNISNASILYEANVEERMTRLMGIFEDWTNLDKIGNVRSLRTYFTYWAFEWDAFIIHYGGPYFINDLLAQPTTNHLNGDLNSDADGFFRSSDRNAPHNGYASGPGLLRVIGQKEYSLTDRGLTDESHYRFATKAEPNALTQYGKDAKNATYIDMSGCYPLTRCYFEYNESDGLYYRSQHLSGSTDQPHIDAATGEQLSFKNILIQNVIYEELGEGYLAFQCHDTTNDGWFFTNGKGIHVTWEKTSDYGATRYYDDKGNEITLNSGKTMVCIIEDGDNFTFR